MTQEQYGMWLCSIEGIGSQTIRKLINRFGTPEEVYTRTEEQLKRSRNWRQGEKTAYKWKTTVSLSCHEAKNIFL